MANMFELITKNLFSKPVTRAYPLAPEREAFERSRGQIVFDNKDCIYCGICMRKCPADAIKVDRKENKWELDTFRCIICGECAVSCPKKSIVMSNKRKSCGVARQIHTDIKPKVETPAQPAAKPATPAASTPVTSSNPSETKIAGSVSSETKIAD